MRERQPPHHLGHGTRLGAVGAQEFQPRRRGEEEVAHLDLRAAAAACRRRLAQLRRLPPRSPRRAPRRRGATRSKAARRRRWRRAPRRGSRAWRWRRGRRRRASTCSGARRASARSARRMPTPSSATRMRLLPPPAVTISMRLRAGVERVLDELLHDARRALDHLAGGDAVDDMVGQTADRHGLLAFRRIPAQAESPGERRSAAAEPARKDSSALLVRCPRTPPARWPPARDRRSAGRSDSAARCGRSPSHHSTAACEGLALLPAWTTFVATGLVVVVGRRRLCHDVVTAFRRAASGARPPACEMSSLRDRRRRVAVFARLRRLVGVDRPVRRPPPTADSTGGGSAAASAEGGMTSGARGWYWIGGFFSCRSRPPVTSRKIAISGASPVP